MVQKKKAQRGFLRADNFICEYVNSKTKILKELANQPQLTKPLFQ